MSSRRSKSTSSGGGLSFLHGSVIHVDGHRIQVSLVEPGHPELGENNIGHVSLQKGHLMVDSTIRPLAILETLTHEIMHLLLDRRCPGLPKEWEEPVVEGLANGLVALFAGNPEFLTSLIDLCHLETHGKSHPKANTGAVRRPGEVGAPSLPGENLLESAGAIRLRNPGDSNTGENPRDG